MVNTVGSRRSPQLERRVRRTDDGEAMLVQRELVNDVGHDAARTAPRGVQVGAEVA
jgi:hypothetical protein